MSNETGGSREVEIKISAWIILKIIGVGVGLWLVYLISDIIAMVAVALIFAAIIGPAADWFAKKKIPRPVGVVIIYIVLFSLIGLVIGLLVPPLISEIKDLANNFSYLWEKVASSFVGLKDYGGTASLFPQTVEKALSTLQSFLTSIISGAFTTVTNIFGGVFSFIAVAVITFYLVIQEDALKKMFYHFIPDRHVSFVEDICGKMQKKIALWLRGQLILCLVVGLVSYVGLLILGVKYALLLGILAGLMEIVPYAGPFLGGTVAVLFALAQSPFKAFMVVILYVIIQQLENNLLVPKVMEKVVGINPITSIIALLVGFRLGGIVGMLFAIPVATALEVLIRAFVKKSWPKKTEEV
ncbi:MAG: AI-2E family transporter [bacterium]|nr:AI-2E family transporter [bacterium]